MGTYMYDQGFLDISMIHEESYRKHQGASAQDAKVLAATTTYSLPIVVPDGADLPLPIRTKEEIYGIGSGKYPSKIVSKMPEPVEFTLSGPIQNAAFLAYALGKAYTSTATQSQVTMIDCLKYASLTNETYFQLLDGTDNHFVWFDTTGTGSAPAGTGTALEVTATAAMTATAVATAMATVIATDPSFGATATKSIVTITGVTAAKTTEAYDVDSNLRIWTYRQGVTASEKAQRILEGLTYELQSFTLHCEQRNTTTGESIYYDLMGCVIDTLVIEIMRENGTVNCSATIKCPAFVAGEAQTTPPGEADKEMFMWNQLATSNVRLIDESHTERTPSSTNKITITISNNVTFKPAIGDEFMAYATAGKRDLKVELSGHITDKTLFDFWKGLWDNVNKKMSEATTKISINLQLDKTALTDIIKIFFYNFCIREHSCHFQTVDEAVKNVDITLFAAQPNRDKRQAYVTVIDANAKTIYHNQDES